MPKEQERRGSASLERSRRGGGKKSSHLVTSDIVYVDDEDGRVGLDEVLQLVAGGSRRRVSTWPGRRLRKTDTHKYSSFASLVRPIFTLCGVCLGGVECEVYP